MDHSHRVYLLLSLFSICAPMLLYCTTRTFLHLYTAMPQPHATKAPHLKIICSF